jgi:hypothetical protein
MSDMSLPDYRLAFEFNGKIYLVEPDGVNSKDVQLPDSTLLQVRSDSEGPFAKPTSVTKLDKPSGKPIVQAVELQPRKGGGAPPGALS